MQSVSLNFKLSCGTKQAFFFASNVLYSGICLHQSFDSHIIFWTFLSGNFSFKPNFSIYKHAIFCWCHFRIICSIWWEILVKALKLNIRILMLYILICLPLKLCVSFWKYLHESSVRKKVFIRRFALIRFCSADVLVHIQTYN